MHRMGPDAKNPPERSRLDEQADSSTSRKTWVKPAATIEQVRDVTTSNFRGGRFDGTSTCSS